MSERYQTSHYAGSVFVIIDTASSEKMNMEDACRELNEQADRLNELERENKRFRDVLEMDDGENPETLRQELMELAEVTIRIREENADLKTQVAEETHECNKLLDERRNLQTEVGDLRRQLAEATELIEALITEYGAECPVCHGGGVARCDNPDHEFIALTGGEIGRLGCPVCGHDSEHRVKGEKCEMCDGTGSIIPPKEADHG